MATVSPVWVVAPLPKYLQETVLGSGTGINVESPWLCVTVTWSNVDGGDTAIAAPTGYLVDKSVQISGTTVTSVAIQGSNDNLEYYDLSDPQGNALTGIGAEKIEQILENTLYIKPVVTTGTDVDITVFGRIPVV
jgi:hypothetical protein